MPTISDKLKSLGVQIGTDNIKAPPKPNIPIALTDVFDGSWEKNASGECFVVKKYQNLNSTHGNIELKYDFDPSILNGFPGLDGISSIPLDQYLFIDTETTGLSGGVGSFVFLIGAARFVNNQVEFAQFFLEDPSNESSQLRAFEEFSSAAKVLVSYNGKSFDLPRIKTRFRYHGWATPFKDKYHLDLLHIIRRIWKDHFTSCSLGDIEHNLLGVSRSSLDVPGCQVASLFFEYLQSGDPNPLKSVFYHNEVDVISLIALLIYLADRLTNPALPPNHPVNDQISIGIFLLHLKQQQAAFEIFDLALDNKNIPENQKGIALYHKAQIHKKKHEYAIAVSLWKRSASSSLLINPCIELAMYFEHKENDFTEAMHWTLSAIESFSKQSQSDQLDNTRDALNHRLARLKRKMSLSSAK